MDSGFTGIREATLKQLQWHNESACGMHCPYCTITKKDEEIERLRAACEHTAYYALDNVSEEVRRVAKAALGGDE
jgi:hypothetical protein